MQFVLDSGPGAPRTIDAGSLPADGAAHSLTAGAAGLTPGAAYSYHVHAGSTGGSSDGQEQMFTTLSPSPARPAPPVLSHVGITKRRFAVGRRRRR